MLCSMKLISFFYITTVVSIKVQRSDRSNQNRLSTLLKHLSISDSDSIKVNENQIHNDINQYQIQKFQNLESQLCAAPVLSSGSVTTLTSEPSFLKQRPGCNHQALDTINILERTATTYPEKVALVYGDYTNTDSNTQPLMIKQTYAETWHRCKKLANGIRQEMGNLILDSNSNVKSSADLSSLLSINHNSRELLGTVGIVSPNTPSFLELHYGVTMAGYVSNLINTRLDAKTMAYILAHAKTRLVFVDVEFEDSIVEAIEIVQGDEELKGLFLEGESDPSTVNIKIVRIEDPIFTSLNLKPIPPKTGSTSSDTSSETSQILTTYESLIHHSPPLLDNQIHRVNDEWESHSISYTSGTTGRPKGVLYSHRGVVLNSINNILIWPMPLHPVYLWTLPMFHCAGWTFPYSVTMQAGIHVCLRKVEGLGMWNAIKGQRVSHLCGAPIVMKMLIDNADPKSEKEKNNSNSNVVKMMTAAAPPPPSVIKAMEANGFDVTHVYGLTEVYGPATVNPYTNPNVEDSDDEESYSELKTITESEKEKPLVLELQHYAKKAQQGVRYPLLEGLRVVYEQKEEDSDRDSNTTDQKLIDVPQDASTIGEIIMRGNIVMKGYHRDQKATEKAFKNGYFWTGDLAVVHPPEMAITKDGKKNTILGPMIRIVDRAKDIIISGGENISSVELENILFQHPRIREAAIVAKPHPQFQEVPAAFVVVDETDSPSKEELEKLKKEIFEFLNSRVAKFKKFKSLNDIVFLKEAEGGLPKNNTGKVQKKIMREWAKEMAKDDNGNSKEGSKMVGLSKM